MSSSRRPSVVATPRHESPRRPQPRPRGNSSVSNPQPPHQRSTPAHTKPATVKLNTSALRSLPYRLIHPPPPPPNSLAGPSSKGKGKAKAAWWQGWTVNFKIQPEYDVRLEDVLERKHLPPLGLKDFEEWLLFVEGSAENLYFILWLREYTARYTAWTASLRSTRSNHLRLSSVQTSPLQTSISPPLYRHHNSSQRNSHVVVHPERPFASLGLAMSSISLAQPSTTQTPYPSYPTFSPPSPSTPSTAQYTHQEELPLDVDDDDARSRRTYKTQYSSNIRPPPNTELAMFYLRAKETFLTPNADYELDVGSEVLSVFHVGAQGRADETEGMQRSGTRLRRDSGVAVDPWEREREIRYGSSGDGMVEVGGLIACTGPTNSGIYPPDPAVFAELKEIVERRLRESLSRLVVATYNNVGMPRAYCGSAGGCVIALVTSSPPLVTSFAFGGPRWYRLIALPGLWLGLTIFVSAMYGVCMMIYVFGDLRQLRSFELARVGGESDKVVRGQRDASEKDGEASREKRTWNVVFGFGRAEKTAVATARPSSEDQETLPFRKESLVPVVNPVPLLPPPRAHTASIQPRGRPTLRVDVHSDESKEGDLKVPPRAITVVREVVDSNDASSSVSFANSEDESGSEDEDDEGTCRATPLPIEISDAFYDENPSPEGPATAPADWHPANLERMAAQRPLPLPHGQTGSPSGAEDSRADNPLWPDYTGNEEWLSGGGAGNAGRGNSRRGETALFIGPFLYDGSESSCVHHGGKDDIEKAMDEMDSVQAHQPMGGFDFDGLPARRTKSAHRVGRRGVKSGSGKNKKKGKEVKRRSLSPQSMISMSTNGKPERWYWALVEWMQTKCGPGNVVDVLERRGGKDGRERGAADDSQEMDVVAGHEDFNEKRGVDLEKAAPSLTANSLSHLPRNKRRNPGQWRLALRKVYLAVPAFASPLTPVLNPLVGRAQWEIVVRSALVSFVMSSIVVGGLLGVPETHR